VRDYGKTTPRFWIGSTGRALRGKPPAQVLAHYLISSPHANMIGVYWCPRAYMVLETGLSEKQVDTALDALSGSGFAFYDDDTESVYVPQMARIQIAETLLLRDNRHKGVIAEAERQRESPFLAAWWDRYQAPYNLPRYPFKAPCKPLASQEQEQEQLQEEEQEQEKTPPKAPPRGGYTQEFETWYAGYPNRVGKAAAARAFKKARQRAELDALRAGVERYKASKPVDREWCNPSTWLNQDRWLDELPKPDRDNGKPKKDHANVAPAHPCHGHKRGDKWHDAEDPDILHAIGLDGWWYRGTAGNAVKREKVV